MKTREVSKSTNIPRNLPRESARQLRLIRNMVAPNAEQVREFLVQRFSQDRKSGPAIIASQVVWRHPELLALYKGFPNMNRRDWAANGPFKLGHSLN